RDQKSRTARPVGLVASVLIRSLPFALLYAAFRLFDSVGVAVLLGAIAVRLGTAAGTALIFRDGAGLRALWLLPLRDLTGLLFWVLAMGKRRVIWRGRGIWVCAACAKRPAALRMSALRFTPVPPRPDCVRSRLVREA